MDTSSVSEKVLRHRAADKRYRTSEKAKALRRARVQRWRAKNRDRQRAHDKKYRTSLAGRAKRIAYAKQYNAAYLQEHAEENRARVAAWEKDNPERASISKSRRTAKRRALIRQVLSDLTQEQWEMVLAASKQCCVYCGKKGRLSMDHLTAYAKGGANTLHNVLPACSSCNSRKHAGNVLNPVQPFLL